MVVGGSFYLIGATLATPLVADTFAGLTVKHGFSMTRTKLSNGILPVDAFAGLIISGETPMFDLSHCNISECMRAKACVSSTNTTAVAHYSRIIHHALITIACAGVLSGTWIDRVLGIK